MPLKEFAERRNLLHRKSDSQTILKHVLSDVQLGPVALVSSFGAEAVVLLHMVSEIDKATPVIFLDTEMLFPETLRYQRDLSAQLGLSDLRVITPDRSAVLTQDVDGLLHQADVDACCDLRKTQPLNAALAGFEGWITGRKRYHGGQRTTLPLFEKDARKIKVNPLAKWTAGDVRAYIDTHHLPRHPLVAQGFGSVGCIPCTTRASSIEDPRAGRWANTEKTECGIHNAQQKGKAA
jgi:phosphoadenosine phosphosulfate reductase